MPIFIVDGTVSNNKIKNEKCLNTTSFPQKTILITGEVKQ